MEARFSLDHLTVLECTPPELVHVAADAGYDCVGLRTMPLGIPGEPDCEIAHDPVLMRRTREALAATGLPVSDIELVRVVPSMDPRSYEAGFAAGAEIGARDVTASIWTADGPYAREMFEQLCEIARPYGLRLNLEFVAIAEIRTLREALAFLRSVEARNVGVVVDTYHFYRAGAALEELADIPPEWLHFCQLCDAPAAVPASADELRDEVRDRRLYLGEGAIDVAEIVARMPETIYALEIPNLARLARLGPAGYASTCLQRARRYFAEHGRRSAAGSGLPGLGARP